MRYSSWIWAPLRYDSNMRTKEYKELTEPMITSVTKRFRALSDKTRVRLLLRLKAGEHNVSSLAEAVGINQSSASKHLRILREAGLIQARHEGQQTFYAIADQTLFDVCRIVCAGVVRAAKDHHRALVPSRSRR